MSGIRTRAARVKKLVTDIRTRDARALGLYIIYHWTTQGHFTVDGGRKSILEAVFLAGKSQLEEKSGRNCSETTDNTKTEDRNFLYYDFLEVPPK